MGATTTTTITEQVSLIEGAARLWFQSQSLFYPDNGRARQWLQWKDLRGQPGVSHRFNKYSEITAGDATEGDDYTNTSALDTSGGVTVTAGEKVVIVPVTDIAKRGYNWGPEELISNAGRACGLAMAKKFDKDVFALNSSLGTSKNGTGTPLLISEFMLYMEALQANDAPEPYMAAFHPWGWYEFVTESSSPVIDAAKSDRVGAEFWGRGFVQEIMGVACFRSTNVPLENANADYGGLFMSSWAIGCVLCADMKIELERDASARLTELVCTMTYGVGVIDSTMGFQLLQDAD